MESLRIWDTIPSDTDVLITHGPPLGKCLIVCQNCDKVKLFNGMSLRVYSKYFWYEKDYFFEKFELVIMSDSNMVNL